MIERTRRRSVFVGLLMATIAVAAIILRLNSSDDTDARPLVFASSSLAPVQQRLDAAIVARGGVAPEWFFAGSSSLVAQLIDGAPADVLLTADETTFTEAKEAGVIGPAEAAFATNTLVLAVAPGNPGQVGSLDDLADPDRLIGVCAPEVPCGRLAAEAATGLGATLAADTEEPNARALTAKIKQGELDAGVIYITEALAADLEIVETDGLDDFETTYFGAARQSGQSILSFLASDAAQSILAEAGFGS